MNHLEKGKLKQLYSYLFWTDKELEMLKEAGETRLANRIESYESTFGGTREEITKNVRSHLESCPDCRKLYEKYVQGQAWGYVQLVSPLGESFLENSIAEFRQAVRRFDLLDIMDH